MTNPFPRTPVTKTPAADAEARCAHCEFPLATAPADGEAGFCCYGCSLAHEISGGGEQGEINTRVAQLLVGVFFSMLVMVFSVPLYSDAIFEAEGSGPALGWLTPVFGILAGVASVPVLLLLGWPVARNALRTGLRGSVDLLILVGVLSAFTLSVARLMRGEGEVYFETASLLLVLLTAGRALEAAGKMRTREAFRALLELGPSTATRLRRRDEPGEREETVEVEELERGDVVRILAGERIPVDGTVLDGISTVDRALLTGESWPELVEPGGTVHAGTLNLEATLALRVDRVTGERWLDRIVALVEEACSRRGRFDRLAERLGQAFLPVAVLVGLGATAWWWSEAGPGEALLIGLSTLLIACPCALGLATPLATWAGLRRAARAGVLVRDPEVFEIVAAARYLALDKTGTITEAELELGGLEVIDPAVSRAGLFIRARALCRESTHPISRAIERLDPAGLPGVEGEKLTELKGPVRTVAGRGLEAPTSRGLLAVGSDVHARELLGESIRPDERALLEVERRGPAVFVVEAGRLLGCLTLRERPRPGLERLLHRLEAGGLAVEILSGDRAERVEALGEQLGIPASGGLTPADKVEHLEDARRRYGRVVMVGDGLNDAPVLAAADVGVAVSGGAEVTCETARAILLVERGSAPLDALGDLLSLSRSTRWRIRFNLLWAFGYNSIGMGLAATGRVHPLLAAALMAISSLLVVATSLLGDAPPPARVEPGGPREPEARIETG